MLHARDAHSLTRLLPFGQPRTRRALARSLLESARSEAWAMLAATVRSHEPWLLRARCLERVGMVTADSDEPTAKLILGALLDRLEQ